MTVEVTRMTDKLVVLGPGGVGKTSLVVQFLEGLFDFTYKPTVEDYYRHIVQLPGNDFISLQGIFEPSP